MSKDKTAVTNPTTPVKAKYQIGDKVKYKDRVVNVLKDRGQKVRIQDNGREFDVDTATLEAIPQDTPITSRGTIGKGSVIPKEVRKQYKTHKTKTGSGASYSIDNDDQTAAALRGKPLDEVYEAAVKELAEHGETTTVAELKAKYGKLNVGMQRMNLGNRIRGAAIKLATKKKRDEAKAAADEAKAKKRLEAENKVKDETKALQKADANPKTKGKVSAGSPQPQHPNP